MFDLDRLYWENKVIEINRQIKKTADLAAGRGEMRVGEWHVRVDGDRLVLNGKTVDSPYGDKRDFALDVRRLGGYQAYELAEMLPRDVSLLTAMVSAPDLPLEARAKILEVVILRGALNEASYQGMSSVKHWAMETDAGPQAFDEYRERKHEFEERRRYQEGARDAIMRSPSGAHLFDQLSRSGDTLPTHRTAATEFMNTMLRRGGLHGGHDSLQELKKELLTSERFPAETRGRMMYHMLDAGHNSDIHLKGEMRSTGQYLELSMGYGAAINVGEQWARVADNHWRAVGQEINRSVNKDLEGQPSKFTAGYESGFKAAAGLDKRPSPQ